MATEEAPMNLKLINPIPLPKTLVLVNNFVVNTTHFLNQLSGQCETKLSTVSMRITNIETSLAVLECKLRSIDGMNYEASDLPDASAPEVAPQASMPQQESAPQQADSPEAGPEGAGVTSAIDNGSAAAGDEATLMVVSDPDGVPEGMIKAREHERFRKFFKMMDMHIPEQAVRIKIQAEEPDLDPDVLSDGDRLIPI